MSRPADAHEAAADRIARSVLEPHGQGGERVPAKPLGPTPNPGRATSAGLPSDVQREFGARLGHDFSRVRVHDDTEADRESRRLDAAAFTVGRDIYFRSGLYAPNTPAGRELLAHELVHVRQQHGSDPRIDRKIFTQEELEDMDPPSTTPRLELLGSDPAFETFAKRLKDTYGVTTVRRGLYSEQAAAVASDQRVHLPAGVTKGTLDPTKWKPWSPPSGWATYRNILKAFETFGREFGRLPPVREVVLYDVDYTVNPTTGAVQADPSSGASFGVGQLTLYSAVAKADPLPTGRSGVPVPLAQATLAAISGERDAIAHNIAHELGHGVWELASDTDPAIMAPFARTVGWTAYQSGTPTSTPVPPRLFDVGVQAVRDALAAGTQPPGAYRITSSNWNEGRWIEQPISMYATDNPGDDFAESVAAFVTMPSILKARSPIRYQFVQSVQQRLEPPKPAKTEPRARTGDPGLQGINRRPDGWP